MAWFYSARWPEIGPPYTAHYGYYGITGNGRRIRWYLHQVERIWKKWLSRRGRHGNFRWDRLRELLSRHPLPPARIMRQYTVPSETLP